MLAIYSCFVRVRLLRCRPGQGSRLCPIISVGVFLLLLLSEGDGVDLDVSDSQAPLGSFKIGWILQNRKELESPGLFVLECDISQLFKV